MQVSDEVVNSGIEYFRSSDSCPSCGYKNTLYYSAYGYCLKCPVEWTPWAVFLRDIMLARFPANRADVDRIVKRSNVKMLLGCLEPWDDHDERKEENP